MALTVLAAPPAVLLSTLDRVKSELAISDTSSDDLLNEILARASSAVTVACGRPYFGLATYSETCRGSGSQILALSAVPLLTISSVYQDTELLSPIDPTNPNDPNLTDGYYIEDATAGAVYRPGGWGQTVALNSWGWEAYASRYILPGGTNTLRYTVVYQAGYFLPGERQDALANPGTGIDSLSSPADAAAPPPLPGAIEQATLETVRAWWFGRQRDPAIVSERIGDQAVSYGPGTAEKVGALPLAALGYLRNYRRIA